MRRKRCDALLRGRFRSARTGAFGSKGGASRSCGVATSRGIESGDIHSSRKTQRKKEKN